MSVAGRGLTSPLRVPLLITCLAVALVCLTDPVSLHDPLEPDTPPPIFLEGPEEFTVQEGDRAVLPCKVKDLGTKQVTWKRMDQNHFLAIGDVKWVQDDAMFVDHRANQLADLTSSDLVFDPVRAEHGGVYECQISAKQKYSRYFTLRVVGPPVKKGGKPGLVLKGEKYVNLGDRISLTCTAHTGPSEHQDIDWFKDGDKMVSGAKKGLLITKHNPPMTKALVSELSIDRSGASDTGTYICRSATDEIESLKVTVLNADTTNVKRDDDRDKGKHNLPMSVEDDFTNNVSAVQCRPLSVVLTGLFTLLIALTRCS